MTGRIQRSPHAASRKIGGQTFLIPPEAGALILLNEVGGRVWELLDGSRTMSEIAQEITEEYEVEDDVARLDVERFLNNLERRGLASPAGTIPPAAPPAIGDGK